MPTISNFYGIRVCMYFKLSEHMPPHIHAFYGEHAATFSIETGEVLRGELPKRASSLVKEWVELHKEELYKAWENQSFESISPLD